jgi:hypothetical protein
MKLKLTPDGQHAIIQNGRPVYIQADGSETTFDAVGTMAALNRRHFETSQFVKERLTVPVDVALAAFGPSFKVEDGKFVAHDGQGMMLYSYTRPGEAADFDEAMERLVSQYPEKEKILRPAADTGNKPPLAGAGSGAPQKSLGKMGDTRAERVEYLSKRFPELP